MCFIVNQCVQERFCYCSYYLCNGSDAQAQIRTYCFQNDAQAQIRTFLLIKRRILCIIKNILLTKRHKGANKNGLFTNVEWVQIRIF